ncbi:hypothetical protein BEWA_019000 [Theileria equi strain WA]|uniref:methylated diphthine methylhydrolase n=1 Tax=Theileria equi strain WA TaxID=1537102 RepID=L0AU30_THEEQ|nr:hypothetical protein BEWA_019000 [Theileria equi strain WA]AFZ79055.1 hypothetical protein BEWA_019000 [Theileria equi strain WA]|eukprot:XP_004828721.1 hypothetical protein BEWA_019000 [Theileria equi strain WA]
MKNLELLAELDLCSQPDTIKPFPSDVFPDSVYSGSFLVGTYCYDQRKDERCGSLICFNPRNYIKQKLYHSTNIHEVPTFHEFGLGLPGILSCSWVCRENSAGILCLTSDLKVVQFDAIDGNLNSEYKFEKVSQINLDDESSSVGLSLTPSDIYGKYISITSSNGYVYIVKDDTVINRWKAHDLEVWTSVFDPNNVNVILTGSDDSYIKRFDLRENINNITKVSCHSSGVTTLQFSPNNPNLLYSGGFDKNLFQFDTRNFSTPISTIKTLTSIWYIDFVKYHKTSQLHIAGCYDGAVTYNLVDDEIDIGSSMHYNTGNSLFYYKMNSLGPAINLS